MRQPQLPFADLPPREKASTDPVVYIVSRLSQNDAAQAQRASDLSSLIADSAVEAALTDDPRWALMVHTPALWSAPQWGGNETPGQIYRKNSRWVWEASAVIVIGENGGSFGGGQEFAWAASLRLPILYLNAAGSNISRQIAGTPIYVRYAHYRDEDDIRHAVDTFVRNNRNWIQDQVRRRLGRELAAERLHHELTDTWLGLSPAARKIAADEAHLHPARASELASDVTALAAAGLDEIRSLSGALGVDLGRMLSGEQLPHLESREHASLSTTASEFGWDGTKTLKLLIKAQLERAKEGVRRFRLSTPEDWVRFAENQELD